MEIDPYPARYIIQPSTLFRHFRAWVPAYTNRSILKNIYIKYLVNLTERPWIHMPHNLPYKAAPATNTCMMLDCLYHTLEMRPFFGHCMNSGYLVYRTATHIIIHVIWYEHVSKFCKNEQKGTLGANKRKKKQKREDLLANNEADFDPHLAVTIRLYLTQFSKSILSPSPTISPFADDRRLKAWIPKLILILLRLLITWYIFYISHFFFLISFIFVLFLTRSDFIRMNLLFLRCDLSILLVRYH